MTERYKAHFGKLSNNNGIPIKLFTFAFKDEGLIKNKLQELNMAMPTSY